MATLEDLLRIGRKWRIWLIVLLTTPFIWAILGLYFIFYPLGVVPKLVDYQPRLDPLPCVSPEVVRLDGLTLFVGDLHLAYGEDYSRLSSLARFVSSRGVRIWSS